MKSKCVITFSVDKSMNIKPVLQVCQHYQIMFYLWQFHSLQSNKIQYS